MELVQIICIATGLSMDAFAVAVAVSMNLERVTGRHIFRFSFHFGLFQALMPVLGWLAGRTMGQWFTAWDHWIAFGLLTAIGCKAVYEGWSGPEPGFEKPAKDPTRGWSLVAFSVATSIDAFAVGLSLALLEVDIWYPVTIIGLTTGGLTLLGMLLGSRIGARLSGRMAMLGGLILIGIGVKILVQSLTG